MNITFCGITPGRFKCSAKGCGADALVRVNASNCCGEHAADLMRAAYIAAVDTLAKIIQEANARGDALEGITVHPYGATVVHLGRARLHADDLPRGGP